MFNIIIFKSHCLKNIIMITFVIIPAHNEERNIRKVIIGVKKYVSNIVVVDDGSNDQTAEIAKSERVHVLRHIINLGKGAALKTGCDFAYAKKASKIIVIDADGQHDTEKIPEFIKHLENSEIVFGYRELGKSMPFILRFGNFVINKVTTIFFKMKLRDTQCGYRAFRAIKYPQIRWNSSDYSMESEMIANAGKNKIIYSELPIATIYADKYKGTTVLDGFKIVMKMFIWRLQ